MPTKAQFLSNVASGFVEEGTVGPSMIIAKVSSDIVFAKENGKMFSAEGRQWNLPLVSIKLSEVLKNEVKCTIPQQEVVYARIGLARSWNNGYWPKSRCYPMIVSLLTDKDMVTPTTVAIFMFSNMNRESESIT